MSLLAVPAVPDQVVATSTLATRFHIPPPKAKQKTVPACE
jgi:hypothetical protein